MYCILVDTDRLQNIGERVAGLTYQMGLSSWIITRSAVDKRRLSQAGHLVGAVISIAGHSRSTFRSASEHLRNTSGALLRNKTRGLVLLRSLR